MGLIKDVVDYIQDNDVKLIVENNNVKIINYVEIVRFDDNIIIIKHDNGTFKINGQNLFIAKLLTKEILIGGHVKTIEFG